MPILWRIAGLALVAGLVLFLVSLLLKVLLVALGIGLLVRVVGARLAGGRVFGRVGRGQWPSSGIISIDNPAYHSAGSQTGYARIIPIN